MEYNDLKKYNGYLPLRSEHQIIFNKLGRLVPGYTDNLFKSKWTGLYNIKIYKGERQVVRLREKERSVYRYIPLTIWLNLSDDKSEYTKDTWRWITEQKNKYSNQSRIVRATGSIKNDPLNI